MEPQSRVEFDTRISLPSNILFVGATQSGKTTLCLHLITNTHLLHPKPKRIIFHYDQFQKSYLDAKEKLAKEGIELLLYKGVAGLSLESFSSNQDQTILLIDDFSEETSSSNEIAKIATNGRHKNLSLWLVWHSLYSKHAASRMISQNIRYFFFLPSFRLESQLEIFGRQLGIKNRLVNAFKDSLEQARKGPLSYVLLDTGPSTPDILRIRSNIHSTSHQYCYY